MSNQNTDLAGELSGRSDATTITLGLKTGYMPSPIMQYFKYEHLPANLKAVSQSICELAKEMDKSLPHGPEKTTGLRKLLEAKDCFVRHAVSQ